MKTLNTLVDQLGTILAKKAELAKQEKEIKALLIANGQAVIEGDLFRVTVSHVITNRTDWTKIAKKLEPSRQMITAYTNQTESDRVACKSKLA